MAVQRVVLTLVLVCLVAALSSACLAADDSPRMNEVVVQPYVSKKQFMGCVLVARGDTVLFDRCYCSANLEWNIPNSPDTKYMPDAPTAWDTSLLGGE